jgi:REP-associated tyrosine transposase
MPRSRRYILPNIPHHVFHRGNNRQNVFIGEEDKHYFVKHLNNYAIENKVRIGAYCIMTNHFHLLLFPEDKEGFITLMKAVSQKYSQYFNGKYKRTGKIWENRYKMNIVDPVSIWYVSRYIERNPLRAGMVVSAEEYTYSSAAMHLKDERNEIITEDIIKRNSGKYLLFFHEQDADDEKGLNRLREIIQQEKAIGSEGFLKMLKDKFDTNFSVIMRGRPKNRCDPF